MPWPRGKPKSDETKKKLSISQKGKRLTEEHKAAIKAAWARRKRQAEATVKDEGLSE